MKKNYFIIFLIFIILSSIGLISINLDVDKEKLNDCLSINKKEDIFIDDFEDGSLVGDWTVSGYGGVSTQTANSGSYSAYHNGGTGSITSKKINLDKYNSIFISYWVRRGGGFSNRPENKEDFVVEYYDIFGTWIEIDYFDGGNPQGEIFISEHNLSGNAIHPNFQIRFRQTDGDVGLDYWHFDDVEITGLVDREPPILSNEYLNASSGNSTDYFNFSVEYFDQRPPSYINCIINETSHKMIQQDPTDDVYSDGKTYEFITPLPGGKYVYYFEAYDGVNYVRYPEIGSFTGPTITSINSAAPNLLTFPISPLIGHESTPFKFNAKFMDLDNNPPSQIYVTINDIQYNMVKRDLNDINYIDGCFYTLDIEFTNSGTVIYYYNASDGSNQVGSKVYNDTISIWHLEGFQMTQSGDIYSFNVQIDNISYIYQIAIRINYPDQDFKEYHLLYNKISKNDTTQTIQWDSSKVGSGTLTVDLVITDITGNIITFNNIKTISNQPGMDYIFPIIFVIVMIAWIFLIGAVYVKLYEPKIKIKPKKKQGKEEKLHHKFEEPGYQREIRTVKQRSVAKQVETQPTYDKCPYCNVSLSKSTIDKIKNGYRVYCPSDNCRNPLT